MVAVSCRHVRSSGRLPCSLPTLFSYPLVLPGIVYDVPGVLASGSSLAASAWGYACRRCLRITLGPGHDFPVVSSYWRGRLMGWRLVIVFLSPGRMCLARSIHDGDSRFCAVSVRG